MNIPVIVEDAFNAAKGTDGHVSVPNLPGSKVHNVLLGNPSDSLFDVLRCKTTTSGDDLAANVLSNGRSAVKREEDRSLQLSLGTLNLCRADVEAEAGPFPKGEVNQVVKVGQVLADEVDTPETAFSINQVSQINSTE